MRNQQLWDSISNFSVTAANAPETFTMRLAKENNWKLKYAERVVSEYLRFMYLASFMEVTPSKSIDEAWHLHMIYTRSYWKELCGKILGKEIHHTPGDGSNSDEAKYRKVYLDTMDAYREEFGENPPKEIWGTDEIVKDEKSVIKARRNNGRMSRILGIITGTSSVLLMTSVVAWWIILGAIGLIIVIVLIVSAAMRSDERDKKRRNSGCSGSSGRKSKDDKDSWGGTPGCSSSTAGCSTSGCSSSDSGGSSCGSGGDSGGGGSSCGGSSCGSSCGGGCGGGD